MKKKLARLLLSLVIIPSLGLSNTEIMIALTDTGSSLHIFQYQSDGNIPQIREIFSRKNLLPVSTFQTYPAKASLKSLLITAQQKLNEWHIAQPDNIEVIGLSHMQLLPPSTVKSIYNNIQNEVSVYFPQTPITIRTISGKQQALYGWLEVNYQLGKFADGKTTVGTINISNTATDIAFERPHAEQTIDEMTFTINNHNYIVFTKSYLGLGLAQARHMLQIDDFANTCYPTGNFNLIHCKDAYDKIIKNYAIALPTFKIKKFYTISHNIFQTYHFFDIKKPFDQETIEQEYINKVCHNPWEVLKIAYPATDETELLNMCSDSIFITQMLYHTLQLQPQQLRFAENIHGHAINWARGALLYRMTKKSYDKLGSVDNSLG